MLGSFSCAYVERGTEVVLQTGTQILGAAIVYDIPDSYSYSSYSSYYYYSKCIGSVFAIFLFYYQFIVYNGSYKQDAKKSSTHKNTK